MASLFLTTLLDGSDIHEVEAADEGYWLRPKDDHHEAFSDLVRRVIDHSGDFTVFPQPDGKGGYDGVYIIPLTNEETRH